MNRFCPNIAPRIPVSCWRAMACMPTRKGTGSWRARFCGTLERRTPSFPRRPRALVKSDPRAPAVVAAVQQRQRTLKDPWLTVGHQRPGMAAGRPLPEAQREADEAAQRLQAKP